MDSIEINKQKREQQLATLRESIEEIANIGTDSIQKALASAQAIREDNLSDLSGNRKQQVQELTTLLIKMSMGFYRSSNAILSLISLIHNFKEKVIRESADAKMHGKTLPPLEERLKFFDEISDTIKKMFV